MADSKARIHYADPYLLNPQHRVTVDLVGLGGTGSQVLTMLGRMNASLIALGHPGLHVRGWDPDVVTDANLGRQLFSDSEVGQFKANCLISRINRFFGTDWEAWPHIYDRAVKVKEDQRLLSNILISCVDTIKARLTLAEIADGVAKNVGKGSLRQPYDKMYYWMDFGNSQKSGQVVLGTVSQSKQPEKPPKDQEMVAELPHVLKMFPNLKKQKEEDSGPSCSLAEALTKQDLFINTALVPFGMTILWKLFKEYRIVHHGAYLNLETMNVNPINV